SNNIDSASRNLYELLTAREQNRQDESAQDRGHRIAQADRLTPIAAQELAAILRLPEAAELTEKKKRWLVVAASSLARIPAALLKVEPKNGRDAFSILEKFEVVSLPSASALAAIRAAPEQTLSDGVYIFADPVFEANDPRNQSSSSIRPANYSLQRLPLSRDEASEIQDIAPYNVTLRMGHDASKQEFEKPEVRSARYLHFATHGIVSEGPIPRASLVLSLFDESGQSRDGQVHADELYDRRLGADLVVLSACRSARGRELKGEGLIGLTTGFMHAGVPRVIASQWAVQDGITRNLMVSFYDRVWRQGVRPAQALREAQLELMDDGLPPYYWGSFVFQGEWL
ncbi:MAG: CHAT domain-containing protein, partial [Acidobacteriota bacterium]